MESLLKLLRELDASDRPYIHYLPADEIVSQIEFLANQELITGGQCDYSKMDELRSAGYAVVPLSQDSFGWLMGGIITKKGIVRYG
jgi:hypothetical protein